MANWNNFFLPYVMLPGSGQYPMPVGLVQMLSSTPTFNPVVSPGAAIQLPPAGAGHDHLDLNPVVTEALTQLTWGAPQVLYNGGPVQARVRYYDALARRPGLPPDVAALVSSIDPVATVVTLVNLAGAQTRSVVVQAGAFGQHDIAAVT